MPVGVSDTLCKPKLNCEANIDLRHLGQVEVI